MLTVALATHNGGDRLRKTLESFTSLQIPQGGWTLIVVDNNSSDDTPQVLDEFKSRLPLLTLFQPKRGKNAALNMALAHLEGDIVIFTDDDILAAPDWLIKFQALAEEHTDFSIFGGKVVPSWPCEPPEAIVSTVPLSAAFAVHDDDITTGPVNPGLIWGPNMMIRREVFDAGHRFNEAVGPSAGNYMMGSETEFIVRLVGHGYQCYFSTDIVVHHIIREEQLTMKWLERRAYRFGRQQSFRQEAALREAPPAALLGYPRWKLPELTRQYIAYLSARVRGDEADIHKMSWELNFSLGWLVQARKVLGARDDGSRVVTTFQRSP